MVTESVVHGQCCKVTKYTYSSTVFKHNSFSGSFTYTGVFQYVYSTTSQRQILYFYSGLLLVTEYLCIAVLILLLSKTCEYFFPLLVYMGHGRGTRYY